MIRLQKLNVVKEVSYEEEAQHFERLGFTRLSQEKMENEAKQSKETEVEVVDVDTEETGVEVVDVDVDTEETKAEESDVADGGSKKKETRRKATKKAE